jgi:hypothetical protein
MLMIDRLGRPLLAAVAVVCAGLVAAMVLASPAHAARLEPSCSLAAMRPRRLSRMRTTRGFLHSAASCRRWRRMRQPDWNCSLCTASRISLHVVADGMSVDVPSDNDVGGFCHAISPPSPSRGPSADVAPQPAQQ